MKIPDGVEVKKATDIELAGCDLVCLAVPSKAIPQAVGTYADKIGSRAAVLLLSKGLIQPMGHLPTDYVSERVRARAIACLGGPAHAREAAAGMAALVLGSADSDLRVQLGEVFDRAGLVCERTDDVVGVEMAGVAKNAAALGAAAAEPHGLNAAGIAAAGIWDECIDYGVSRGARIETFAGLAGVGDLTATILAPGSRNRQAGELLGKGMPAEQIPGKIGQASEGLDSVPLIAETVVRCGDRRAAPREPRFSHRRRDHRRRVDCRTAPRAACEEGRMTLPAHTLTPCHRGTPAPISKAELDREFSELYRAHLRDVYSYAYYRVGNHHDAEDLTEQAFLQAYRHFERARRESNGRPMRPWLIRIAHNLASNLYRDRSRRPRVEHRGGRAAGPSAHDRAGRRGPRGASPADAKARRASRTSAARL